MGIGAIRPGGGKMEAVEVSEGRKGRSRGLVLWANILIKGREKGRKVRQGKAKVKVA